MHRNNAILSLLSKSNVDKTRTTTDVSYKRVVCMTCIQGFFPSFYKLPLHNYVTIVNSLKSHTLPAPLWLRLIESLGIFMNMFNLSWVTVYNICIYIRSRQTIKVYILIHTCKYVHNVCMYACMHVGEH